MTIQLDKQSKRQVDKQIDIYTLCQVIDCTKHNMDNNCRSNMREQHKVIKRLDKKFYLFIM